MALADIGVDVSIFVFVLAVDDGFGSNISPLSGVI
jgi:hypothetical protein